MFLRLERLLQTWWGMLLAFSAIIAATLLPQLSGFTEVLSRTYQPFQFSVLAFYKIAIESGSGILWNPYIFSGFPVFVSVTGGFFSPIFYGALKVLSVPLAYHGLTFLNLVLSAFFTAHVAKKLTISTAGQFLAGIIYAFGGWHYIFFLPATNVLWLLPLLVLLLMETDENPRWWLIGGGVLGVFLGWISSHWQWLLLVLLASGMFAGYFSYRRWRDMADRPSHGPFFLIGPLFHFFVMVLGGTFFGLIQIVPTLSFVSLSVQLADGYSHTTDLFAGINPATFITLFLPYFEHSLISVETVYIGILPILFFLVAFFLPMPKTGFFLQTMFGFLFLLAIAYSPLFWLFHHIPPFNFLHGPQRWIYIGVFPFALLAARGFELFLQYQHVFRIRAFVRVLEIVFLFFVLMGVVTTFFKYYFRDQTTLLLNAYFDEFIYRQSMQYSLAHYHSYLARITDEALRIFDPLNPQFILPLLFFGATWIFLRLLKRNFFKTYFYGIAAVFVTLNLVFVFWAFQGSWSGQKYFSKTPKTAEFILSQNSEGRAFTFLGTQALFERLTIPYGDTIDYQKDLFDFNRELLLLNTNIAYKISHVEYNDPLMSRHGAELLAYIGSPAADTVGAVSTTTLLKSAIPLSQKSHLFTQRHPIISLLGISHIISAYPLDESVFPKVFETTVTSHNIPVYIYENKQARPLYYFTEETELLDLPNTTTPQELQTIIESMNPQAGSWQATTQEGITLQSRGNTRLTLKTKTTKPTILVHSQNNLPGWRVFIDNERIELYTFATVYQAIRIPSGEHEIRFEYSYGEVWREFVCKIRIILLQCAYGNRRLP